MSVLVEAVGFGLVTSAVLTISAVGLTMQFAVTDVLNLAFGGVMILGAYFAYLINNAGLSVWVGVIGAAVGASVLSVLLNLIIYTPFKRRGSSPIALVIVSLGMTLILEFGLQAVVGGQTESYRMNPGGSLGILGMALTGVQLVIIGLAIAGMVAIHVLLRYTRLGKAMRATAANPNLARNCGIRTRRVVTTTWAISGALCGIGGATFAIDAGSFGATSTDIVLVLLLAAVFLGGPGQAYGAMLGAVVIGMATEVSAVWVDPAYKDVVAFLLLLVILGVRPTGLLGARE